MDREPPVIEEELHAFVDGELPAERHAVVEQWLATHADDAARVAAWRTQAEAIEAHRLYVVEVRHPVEVPGSEATHLAQWLSRRIGYSLRAPDLDGSGLKLVGGRLLPSSAGLGAAFFMYEGTTGERFTVYCRK